MSQVQISHNSGSSFDAEAHWAKLRKKHEAKILSVVTTALEGSPSPKEFIDRLADAGYAIESMERPPLPADYDRTMVEHLFD